MQGVSFTMSLARSLDSGGDTPKEGHRELFERFCRGRYLDPNHTSKSKTTVLTEEKVQKITDVLNRVERSDISNPFIAETKKFVLLNYPELKFEDVLYLPAKQRVRN